jgi:hypothetical protein
MDPRYAAAMIEAVSPPPLNFDLGPANPQDNAAETLDYRPVVGKSQIIDDNPDAGCFAEVGDQGKAHGVRPQVAGG